MQRKRTITIKDVAAEAGVSFQTVSRVINKGPNVTPGMHARVTAAIQKLGYVPSLAARRLGGSRSYLILAFNDERPTLEGWQSRRGNDWVDQMLYGGMLADAFDRRRVALVAATITLGSTVLLATLAWAQLETVWWLYALSIVNAAANTVVMAARQAIVPRLIPRELLPAASALNGITFGIMVMVGPALAGILVAFAGYAWTYSIDVLLMSLLFLGLWTLPSIRPEGTIVRPGLDSLRDGWRFLARASNIRLQFILDIIAMTFGQPLALMPAIGAVLLGGGPITTGALISPRATRSLKATPALSRSP
jgi:MFS family permease